MPPHFSYSCACGHRLGWHTRTGCVGLDPHGAKCKCAGTLSWDRQTQLAHSAWKCTPAGRREAREAASDIPRPKADLRANVVMEERKPYPRKPSLESEAVKRGEVAAEVYDGWIPERQHRADLSAVNPRKGEAPVHVAHLVRKDGVWWVLDNRITSNLTGAAAEYETVNGESRFVLLGKRWLVYPHGRHVRPEAAKYLVEHWFSSREAAWRHNRYEPLASLIQAEIDVP